MSPEAVPVAAPAAKPMNDAVVFGVELTSMQMVKGTMAQVLQECAKSVNENRNMRWLVCNQPLVLVQPNPQTQPVLFQKLVPDLEIPR